MTRLSSIASACLGAAFACFAPAASTAQSLDGIVEAHVLPGARLASGGHMAAIELRLAPGWKTYWRSPGEGGIPPDFDWSGSQNVAMIQPHWPVPEVYWQNGLRSIGYQSVVTVPILVMPDVAGGEISLSGDMRIGVCEEVCVPVTLRIEAVLPAVTGDMNPRIAAALSDRPMTADEAGVGAVTCKIAPIADGMRVTYSVAMPVMGGQEEAVVEFADPTVWVAEPSARRDGGQLLVVAELVPSDAAPFALARDDLRLTVFGNGQAVDIRGCSAG
ncbi:MAG: protein-disulfide reductase DsbD domain-containing protein [Pseudomonadota bacterium]